MCSQSRGKSIKPAPAWLIRLLWAFVITFCLAGNIIPTTLARAGYLDTQSTITIYLKGQLVPRHYVELAFGSATRADQVLVKEGEQVEAGDILIRADNYLSRQADLAQALLQKTQAEIALKQLYREAEIVLAQAEVAIVNAKEELALAEDRVESLRRSHSKAMIEQAYANLLLAEKKRDQILNDLQIAQQQYRNKDHILWKFINQRQFRLRVTLLESELAVAERKVVDARDKYEDLSKPVDAIDLAMAEGHLVAAQANLTHLISERDKKAQRPDPDELELALARRKAADANVSAAQEALESTLLKAPISGTVVDLAVQTSEWIAAGQTLITIADLGQWVVKSEDLNEVVAPSVYPGQKAQYSFWAYPELNFAGEVEKIGLDYREEDGDILYAVTLSMEQDDPRLYWGMTVDVVLEP